MNIFCEKISPEEYVKTYDPVIKEVNGRKVQLFVERTKDLNEGLTYSDFSLKSLIDADALDLLQPLSPLSRAQLDAADIANFGANNLSAYIESLKEKENDVEPSKITE